MDEATKSKIRVKAQRALRLAAKASEAAPYFTKHPAVLPISKALHAASETLDEMYKRTSSSFDHRTWLVSGALGAVEEPVKKLILAAGLQRDTLYEESNGSSAYVYHLPGGVQMGIRTDRTWISEPYVRS